MSGYCTYTLYAKVADEDGGGERTVPCGKARVGEAQGPGLRVVVCKRHYDVVAKALAKQLAQPEVEGQERVVVFLTLDQPQGEMAATEGGD